MKPYQKYNAGKTYLRRKTYNHKRENSVALLGSLMVKIYLGTYICITLHKVLIISVIISELLA